MLDYLNFKEKHATLQGIFEHFEKIARFLYANLYLTNLKSRKNNHLALNSDTEVMALVL